MGLALYVEDAPGGWCKLGYEPFAAAAVTSGHIGASESAAVDTGDHSYFWPGQSVGDIGG